MRKLTNRQIQSKRVSFSFTIITHLDISDRSVGETETIILCDMSLDSPGGGSVNILLYGPCCVKEKVSVTSVVLKKGICYKCCVKEKVYVTSVVLKKSYLLQVLC